MRLPDFILANVESILTDWERFARSLTPGTDMDIVALRDHAEKILRSTARDMVSMQTLGEQSSKSKGQGGGGTESAYLNGASEEHAIARLASGFNLIEVVSEYRALRASVLRLWRESVPVADDNDLQDLTRFNESIDQSLAEAVRTYNDRVEQSRELFLATLGHDLRNPLNAIVMSAGLLSRAGQLDSENTRIASQIAEFGKVMSKMIDDLLDFTRSRLGRGMPIFPVPVTLEGLCREVVGQFRASQPRRTLHVQAYGDTSGQWDVDRLRQVVSNLIANAVEHGDENGPIEISIRGEESDVLLSVANQGPPIPPDALPTLFDPFVHGLSTSKKYGSIGLGLYIVREVVMAHGGSVAVTSSASQGTVFSVRLPRGR